MCVIGKGIKKEESCACIEQRAGFDGLIAPSNSIFYDSILWLQMIYLWTLALVGCHLTVVHMILAHGSVFTTKSDATFTPSEFC